MCVFDCFNYLYCDLDIECNECEHYYSCDYCTEYYCEYEKENDNEED